MDQVANLLVSLKNAYMAEKRSFSIPASRFKQAILEILKKYGFLLDWKMDNKILTIEIEPKKFPELKIIRNSKPGRRLYTGYQKLNLPARGLVVLSTPKGLVEGREAKKLRLGGEKLFTINY